LKDLVIFGTGGFAREVHQVVEDLNQQEALWNVLGFLDDDPAKAGALVHDLPVLGTRDWLISKQVAVASGIGATSARRRVVEEILHASPSVEFPALVHPLAWMGNRIQIGQGVVVCAGNLLTTDLRIGDHVILNLDCTVGHDSDLGDFVTVAPSVNISGAVRVGEGCDLGTGSTIIQGVNLGEWSVVGAGAVVVKDVPPNSTVVGVPAKVIKQRPPGWHTEAP
jgi:sugar O-acyltransferase (sialic acid O-acetyltransferase NeuD family)